MSETLVNPDKREEAASAPAEAAARVNLLDFDAAGLKAWWNRSARSLFVPGSLRAGCIVILSATLTR